MIDYPPSHAMVLLAALATGDVVYPDEAGVLRHTAVNGTAPVDRLGFDLLEEKGWIEVVEGGVRVTDRGRWHLSKWLQKIGVQMTSKTRVAVRVGGKK